MAKQSKKQSKLEEVVNLVIANSKDAKYGEKLARNLISLQKQIDNTGVEVHIPISTITDSIDFGATKIQRCAQGFLFTAKGGLQVVVSWRMNAACDMIQQLFNFRDNPTDDATEKEFREQYTSAVLYVFQAPLFACLGQNQLFTIALEILRSFNRTAKEVIESATESEETEADVKANIEEENEQQALDNLIKEAENLPSYEDE
jgi:hypothetical protein